MCVVIVRLVPTKGYEQLTQLRVICGTLKCIVSLTVFRAQEKTINPNHQLGVCFVERTLSGWCNGKPKEKSTLV